MTSAPKKFAIPLQTVFEPFQAKNTEQLLLWIFEVQSWQKAPTVKVSYSLHYITVSGLDNNSVSL